MEFAQHSAIVNFIWNVADDVLRDIYVRSKHRDVILPMTVTRRLDGVLEPTKPAVLAMKERLDRAAITNQDAALILALEKETEGLLGQILLGTEATP
jgi:type I restriction enzyme M protein